MVNHEFLAASAGAALTMISEHAPDGSVIVQAATVCRLIDGEGGVYVVTDVTTSPDWNQPPGLPSISDTLEEEARKLPQHPSGGWHVERRDA